MFGLDLSSRQRSIGRRGAEESHQPVSENYRIMSRKSYPNVNAANQYARDVVRGKIVACQFVIQVRQRHLDDLMAGKK